MILRFLHLSSIDPVQVSFQQAQLCRNQRLKRGAHLCLVAGNRDNLRLAFSRLVRYLNLVVALAARELPVAAA